MPYFPKRHEPKPYRCGGCRKWFYTSNISCCVAHGPGSCCHTYETPTVKPSKKSRNDGAAR